MISRLIYHDVAHYRIVKTLQGLGMLSVSVVLWVQGSVVEKRA